MIVKQIKYYNETTKRFLNNPIELTAANLIRGYYFAGITCDEINIKAWPGTICYINNEKIVIGDIGVYNIPVRENVKITSLQVDSSSMNLIKENNEASFIVTFIEEEKQ